MKSMYIAVILVLSSGFSFADVAYDGEGVSEADAAVIQQRAEARAAKIAAKKVESDQERRFRQATGRLRKTSPSANGFLKCEELPAVPVNSEVWLVDAKVNATSIKRNLFRIEDLLHSCLSLNKSEIANRIKAMSASEQLQHVAIALKLQAQRRVAGEFEMLQRALDQNLSSGDISQEYYTSQINAASSIKASVLESENLTPAVARDAAAAIHDMAQILTQFDYDTYVKYFKAQESIAGIANPDRDPQVEADEKEIFDKLSACAAGKMNIAEAKKILHELQLLRRKEIGYRATDGALTEEQQSELSAGLAEIKESLDGQCSL